MIHTGLYTSKNEEFPALPKSQPISFGSAATHVVHPVGDHDGPSQDSSRKKRTKKRKKNLHVDQNYKSKFQESSEVFPNGSINMHVSAPEPELPLPFASPSEKLESRVAKETFVYNPSHPQNLEFVRTVDDEGFVDDALHPTTTESKFMTTAIALTSESNKSSTSVQQHTTTCLETAPTITRTSLIPPPSISPLDTAQTKYSVSDKEAKSVCANCENKRIDYQVFDSIELPILWDSASSRGHCCGGLPGGDEANGIDSSATDSGSTTDHIVRTNKKTPSGIGDNHHSEDLDEDEMEGTDLLHLISNSLDRFNAIVHPDDLSGLTSGLGASEALLSDLDWSLPDSQITPATVKSKKTCGSVEEFTDNHMLWPKSRLTASSCPNSYSLHASSVQFSTRSNALTPPIPVCPATTLLSNPGRSPCSDESIPTSVDLSQLNLSCSQLVPDSTVKETQPLSKSAESELIYPCMPSIQIRSSRALTSQNDQNSALNSPELISEASRNDANTDSGFTFPIPGLDSLTPWTPGDAQAPTTTIPTTPMQPLLNRPIGSNNMTGLTSTTSSGSFLYQMDHLYKYHSSGSVSNTRLNSNTLNRCVDWLSIRQTASTGFTRNNLLSSTQSASGSVAPPPGLAVCTNSPLEFNSVSGLESALDTTMLLPRDPFLTTQRSGPLSISASQQQQQQPSTTATQGSQGGKGVFSAGLTSDFPWDLKSLDIWSNLYPAYGRHTRPITAGLGLNRNRLPHSDSVAFAGSLTDFNLGTRRASISAGAPFDLHDLVPSDRFDSPESMVPVYGNTVSDVISTSGVMESLKRPVASEPSGTNPSACPPLPHQSSEASFVTAGSPMRLVGGAGAMNGIGSSPATNNALPVQQPRHGSWSTGWLAKSPLLRMTHSENYRHALPHKRYNHPMSRTGGDRTAELAHFPTVMNRPTARGSSPCNPAFQPVASRLMHAPFHLTPRGISSTVSSAASLSLSSTSSSSASSSSCGSLTTANPRSTSNTTEVTAELGKPVVAKWRRACSFYLRGHCKKEDCEFAHDLTKVTCKFWEIGECFKGPTCPFLHGYPPELNDPSS